MLTQGEPGREAHRKPLRLRSFDYSTPGMYFVTICTLNRKNLFGWISEGEMTLSRAGSIATQCWLAIPQHYPVVSIDLYVIMPNHIHGLLWIHPMEKNPDLHPVVLSAVINQYKTAVARLINKERNAPGVSHWQRSFYDHVVREDDDLYRIREYILTNPMRWFLDRENEARTGLDDFEMWLERTYGKRKKVK